MSIRIEKYYRSSFGAYEVTYCCNGPWSYIVDDFGNAVPLPLDTHATNLCLAKAGLITYPK